MWMKVGTKAFDGIAILAFAFLSLHLGGCTVPDTLRSEPVQPPNPSEYYRSNPVGSDSRYSPASAFFDYTLDTLQLPENFDTDNFTDNLDQVWEQLTHPRRSIENEGGGHRFINRELFPIDSEFRRDSFAALPNYALHLLGGGMVYRRDMEWFAARGYRYPRLAATTLAMVSEVLQEALEVQNTTDADPVADVYLFRPLGILLFSHDPVARFVQNHLDPAIWPMISAWDMTADQFTNTGISYAYKPPALKFGDAQLFIYTGLNNLIGLSHSLRSGKSLSWGVGAAVQEIVRQRNIQADLRPSIGLFLDQNKSLLASMVYNDVGKTRFRINLYPGSLPITENLGLFLSFDDELDLSAGLVYRMPIGLALGRR